MRHVCRSVSGADVGDWALTQVQELVAKAPELPSDICWHFIGQLQSNKAKVLVSGVPNLWAVESVDSVKLANKLNSASGEHRTEPLNVYVQVNTSAEEQKGGVDPDEAEELARHVAESCENLRLVGLMTIGKLGSPAAVYFERLAEARDRVAAALSVSASSLELSMGMSSDFELAIEHGADSVRVGTTIFGARDAKGPAAAATTAGPAGGDDGGDAAPPGGAAAASSS